MFTVFVFIRDLSCITPIYFATVINFGNGHGYALGNPIFAVLSLVCSSCFTVCWFIMSVYQDQAPKNGYDSTREWFSNKPLIGSLFSLYQSSYIALEFGKLFYEGLELRQIIFCLKETKQGSLIQLLAFRLTKGLESGISLAQQFETYSFLTAEFSQIVLQGEAKGNLGKELLFYSKLARQHFFQKVNRGLSWIQPVLFLGIASLILLIYAAILLPVYGNIEEVLL